MDGWTSPIRLTDGEFCSMVGLEYVPWKECGKGNGKGNAVLDYLTVPTFCMISVPQR